jgi:hypothetical protein
MRRIRGSGEAPARVHFDVSQAEAPVSGAETMVRRDENKDALLARRNRPRAREYLEEPEETF